MPGPLSPPPRASDPDMHHGTCVTRVPWCMRVSLTSGSFWSRWRGKRSRYSRGMRNPQVCESVKKPIAVFTAEFPFSCLPISYSESHKIYTRFCYAFAFFILSWFPTRSYELFPFLWLVQCHWDVYVVFRTNISKHTNVSIMSDLQNDCEFDCEFEFLIWQVCVKDNIKCSPNVRDLHISCNMMGHLAVRDADMVPMDHT